MRLPFLNMVRSGAAYKAAIALGLAGAFAWVSPTAADGVDSQAVNVRIEPQGSMSTVWLELTRSSLGPFVVHADRASFTIRHIGDTVEVPVPSKADGDASGTNCIAKDDYSICYITERLTLPSLAPGPYELNVQFGTGFADSTSGIALPIAPPRLGDRTLNLYFPAAILPAVAIGTKFIATQDGGGSFNYGSIWTLTKESTDQTGWRTDAFSMTTGKIIQRVHHFERSFSPGELGYGQFAQLIDDPIARRLTDEYVGKPLWTFGRYYFVCRDALGNGTAAETRDRLPLYISSISRVARSFVRIPLGTTDPMYYCGGGCHEEYHVFTDEPLMVTLAPRADDVVIDAPRFISHNSPWRGPCIKASAAYFLDDWAFERIFTLEDPRTAHQEWPLEFRTDLLKYRFDNGMTHEMVALAAGYPSDFGTRSELDKLWHWEWYPTAGYSSQTYFQGGVDSMGGSGWTR